MTIPADFADNRAGMTRPQLQKLYNVSDRTIGRWIKVLALPPKAKVFSKPRLIMPEDFPTAAPEMGKKDLMRRYKVSQRTIDRWLAESGVSAKAPQKWGNGGGMSLQAWSSEIPGAKRDNPEDIAADYLRKWMPVTRCNEKGKTIDGGKLWRAGILVLNDQELIAKADAKRARMENA